MTKQDIYLSKLISLEEALSKIKSGDVIATGSYSSEPQSFCEALHTVGAQLENVIFWSQIPSRDYPFFRMHELKGHIDIRSMFYGGVFRDIHDTGRVNYVPGNLSTGARTIINNRKPNVFVAAVTPMDKHGYVRIPCSQQFEQEMLAIADLVIFEVNPNLPRINGTQEIPIEKADYVVEVDYPAYTLESAPATDIERKIAANAALLVNDGDCIQLGIGGMPNAVGDALLDKKHLGIHTEMITSVMCKLIKAGVVDNSRKQIHTNKTVGAFALGDRELYDLLDDNPSVEIMPAVHVNDPFVISQNDNVVSINSALQVDLTGQVCSESIGHRQFSGTGGAFDFAYGAFRSKGGRSIIAISSTAQNGQVSRIQPVLPPGGVVSISRNIVNYVITEYGIAQLKDRGIKDRVAALISVAHPKFREELQNQADKLMLW